MVSQAQNISLSLKCHFHSISLFSFNNSHTPIIQCFVLFPMECGGYIPTHSSPSVTSLPPTPGLTKPHFILSIHLSSLLLLSAYILHFSICPLSACKPFPLCLISKYLSHLIWSSFHPADGPCSSPVPPAHTLL